MQQSLSKLDNSVDMTFEEIECLVRSRTLVRIRHMNKVMQTEDSRRKNLQIHYVEVCIYYIPYCMSICS
jgi:hypothetical protein